MDAGGGDGPGACRASSNYCRIAYTKVVVNAILHPVQAADVHKAIKLADVGRRHINDGDLYGMASLVEVVLHEQAHRNTIHRSIGVDCLLVGSICRRRISNTKNGKKKLQLTEIDNTWAVGRPYIAPPFNSLQRAPSSAWIREREAAEKQRGLTSPENVNWIDAP